MVGMHGLSWMFWLIVLAAFLFYARDRTGARGDRPREAAHDVMYE